MVRFEWDDRKDAENRRKHGVSFEVAQQAFLDPNRVLEQDVRHSSRSETRYFLYGRADGGILTVRFTKRGENIRIYGAGYWRQGKERYERENGD
jgi:hypothetical protein